MRDNRKGSKGLIDDKVADLAKGEVKDPRAEKLMKMAKGVGNSEVQRRLDAGNATRDELLAFLSQRLHTLKDVQAKEVAVSDRRSQRDWWIQVADSYKFDKTKPDPQRWSQSAKLYEEAAFQLCRGDLSRGKALVEQAMHEEQKQFGGLTKLVDTRDIDTEAGAPAAMGDVQPGQACATTPIPPEIEKLSAEIQACGVSVVDPPGRRRIRDPWWTEEEEEEQEKPSDAANKG